jgi:hypothetical protein
MRLWPAALALALSSAAPAFAPAGKPRLLQAMKHDVSAPLWLIRPVEPRKAEREDSEPRPIPLGQWSAPERDSVLQQGNPPLRAPQATSFEGIGDGFLGAAPQLFDIIGTPPDPEGDVGPSHYVQIVNTGIAVFSKQGTPLFGPVPTRTIFGGFGGACESNDDGDGIVVYDSLADRWLVSQFAIVNPNTGPFLQCVAVSRSPDPTGSYARYAFAYDLFNDYPKLGVWPDGYYATYNTFPNAKTDVFRGVEICVLDRLRMLAGAPASQQCVHIDPGQVSGMTPADFDGLLPPPAGEPGLVLGFAQNSLVLYRYHVDWSDPVNTAVDPVDVPVAPFVPACNSTRNGTCIPQLGAQSNLLDSLSDRMMFRVGYRNLGGREVLVANHTVNAGGSSGIRWYELRDPSGDPFVFQQGTYAPDEAFRWMGSAAMDRAGNIAIGFSVSSANQHPAIAYTGRTTSDPPGVMGKGEGLVIAGEGSQGGSTRWGDYSNLTVDPSDDCTFWYTSEYLAADGFLNWHTRIAHFRLPGCAPPASDFAVWVSPGEQTMALARTATYAISTAALNAQAAGKQLALSLSPLPAGFAASIDPRSVAPGGTATLTLSAAPDAPLGAVPFVVQATDGVQTESAAGSATSIANDFSLALDPQAVVVGALGTVTIRIATAVVAGAAETVAFSVTRLPRGFTAVFDSETVKAGDSTTLRLSGGAVVSATQSIVHVRGASASASHEVAARIRTLTAPFANIAWPTRLQNLAGTASIIGNAAASQGSSLATLDLHVDGLKVAGISTPTSPATLDFDTRKVSDGPHQLTLRAFDANGNYGDSAAVEVWVNNAGSCGCAGAGGGWQALWLFGFLAALRVSRRRRPSALSGASR